MAVIHLTTRLDKDLDGVCGFGEFPQASLVLARDFEFEQSTLKCARHSRRHMKKGACVDLYHCISMT